MSSGNKLNSLYIAGKGTRKLVVTHVLDDDVSRDGPTEVEKSWEGNIEMNDHHAAEFWGPEL